MEIPLEIPLWAQDAPGFDPAIGQPAPGLTSCLVEDARGAVIVLPGGGYAMRADHEGLPVAEMLNRAGISAFVLSYRVAPYRDPVPLLDVRRALRLVRHHRAQLGIERVGVLGFSAGGHLAGCAALLEDGWPGDPQSADPVERESARPDAAVLCYPVATGLEHAHRGSFENLLDGRADDLNELRRLSLELRAGPHAPPCFLWHTADDGSVPVENSLMLAAALRRNGTPFSLHIYPHGRHGLGLAQGVAQAEAWPDECVRFLRGAGF